MHRLRLVSLLVWLPWLACAPSQPPTAATPTPPAVSDTDHCEAAEVRLEELQCRDRRGDPMWVNRKGERFRDTCRTIQEQGGVFLDPGCIANAPTCEEAKACPANQ